MYNLMQYPEKNGAEGKRVYPEAATGQPVVSKDGKTYTFTVRAGHKASNGKTVTAQWFVHAFERLLSPKMGDAASARFGGLHVLEALQGAQAFYDGKAQRISGVQARGNKFIIRLTKPFPSIVTALAMNWFTATDPAMPYSEQDVNSVVGAGPYYIASREAGRTLVLDRNQNYKGNRPANPDRIVVTVAGEPNQSVLQIKAGQADYDPLVPSAAAGALGDEFGVNKGRFFVKPTSATSYWALNSLPGQPLNNVKLRQAINWAIDRPAMVRVSGKFGGRRTSQILPPAMPGFLQSNNIYAYNGANVAKGQAGRGRRQQRARAPRRTLEHDREHQPRPGHAVQPRGDGSQGADGADPERAALLARWGQEGQLRRPGDRLAGRLPGPVELHQRPPRRAQPPGRGVEQQLRAVQQPEVQQADGSGRSCSLATRAIPPTAGSTARS